MFANVTRQTQRIVACAPGHTISAEGGERALNMWKRYVARRHRKQHERIDAERAREKALAGQDVEEAVRNVAQGSAGAQQGMYGHGT